MKIEARYRGKTYAMEVVDVSPDASGGDSGGRFEVVIESSDGTVRTCPVELLGTVEGRWTLAFGDRIEDVQVYAPIRNEVRVQWRSYDFPVEVLGGRDGRGRWSHHPAEVEGSAHPQVCSPMAGKVVSVAVDCGASVVQGETLAVVEAMKMQNEVKAPRAGVVLTCNVRPGGVVNAGDVMFELE